MWTGTEAILCCNTTLSKEKDEAEKDSLMLLLLSACFLASDVLSSFMGPILIHFDTSLFLCRPA